MKLKFPYGNCNFERIISENYFYQDRTDRIQLLENVGENILLLRPRRFGKSLFLSVLENYYDLAKADKFETLFGHLAIGKNPTPNHNQYFVMKWDFSMVDPHGDIEAIVRSLYNHINQQIKSFAHYYRQFLDYEIKITEADALASFQDLLGVIRAHRLYLLIDEYDNFANEVMVSRKQGPQRYEQLLQGEGILKTLFKVIKGTLAGMGLERVFITGVSPVVMSDLTSGQHITRNIYFKPEFNDLCGFREEEVAEMVAQVAVNGGLSAEKTAEAMQMMRIYYNGYCFVPPLLYAPATKMAENIYNPTMVLYFLEHLQNYGYYPTNMLDSNLAPDRLKLAYAAFLPGGGNVILKAVDEQEPLAIPNLIERFGVQEMLEAENDDTFVATLLYYLGMLTIGERNRLGELSLRVPNLTMRGLYFERLQKILLPKFSRNEIEQAVREFYTTGNLQPVCDLVEQRFTTLDNRDYKQADELLVKTAFLAILFNDLYYMINSETALQRGYADLTMILRPGLRQYQLLDHVVEFKYVTLKETGMSGAQLRELSRAELAALPAVQHQLSQAKGQLARYREGLAQIYGDILRLHSHVVVSIGFERAVWRNYELGIRN